MVGNIQVPRYVHKPASRHKFIKFIDCLEAASERTNVPLSSACTWTPFHHPLLICLLFQVNIASTSVLMTERSITTTGATLQTPLQSIQMGSHGNYSINFYEIVLMSFIWFNLVETYYQGQLQDCWKLISIGLVRFKTKFFLQAGHRGPVV